MYFICTIFQVCELREGEKKYITLYYTLEINFLLIRIIKELNKICQYSGPTPDQSNQNPCGGNVIGICHSSPTMILLGHQGWDEGKQRRIWEFNKHLAE